MKGVQSIDEEITTGFERIASNYPDKTAVIYLGRKFSYGEPKEMVLRFAKALYELGVRDNDSVMLYLGNCVQWVIAYFAIQKIGGVVVPTSPIYTPSEISFQLNHSGAKIIICHDTNFGYVMKVFQKTSLEKT